MKPAESSNIMTNTIQQYQDIIDNCKDLFLKKTADYGTSWRVLRPVSIVDQIYIKAWRIRQIQENGLQRVEDSIESEFIGIVNYGLIALIQGEMGKDGAVEMPVAEARKRYEGQAAKVKELMLAKNHDYGEAWREMGQQSFVDLILVKLLRLRQIIANDGKTIVSEGMDANFADIINYAVFALIKLSESKSGNSADTSTL